MRGGFARNRPYLFSDVSVGILLAEVYKGKGDLSVRSVKRFIRANRCNLWAVSSDHRSVLWSIHILKTVSLEQLKGMRSFKPDMWKGYLLSIEVIGKGCLFCQKWYIKAEGVGPRGVASLFQTLFPPPPRPELIVFLYCTLYQPQN